MYVGSDDQSLYTFDAITGQKKEFCYTWYGSLIANWVIEDGNLYANDAVTSIKKGVLEQE